MNIRPAWETHICTASIPRSRCTKEDIFTGLLESARALWAQWAPEVLEVSKGSVAEVLEYMRLLPHTWTIPVTERDWCGWPSAICATGYYQCTGATLLALVLLEQWGISYRIANPVGHVVLMGETNEKGVWWYLDTTPEHQQYHELFIHEAEINGCQLLRCATDAPVPFQVIPVYPRTMLAGLVLDNLALLTDAYERGTLAKEAIPFVEPLCGLPWGTWYQEYFGERIQINEHPLLREELGRLQRAFPNKPQGTHTKL